MKLDEKISLTISKKQELRIWLLRQPCPAEGKRLTLQALADALGIRLSTLSKHLDNPTIPVDHHRILRERFGIPAELLPEPKDLPPGPRPKMMASVHQFM
ncbi:hypothetical protein [Desulfovibrio sp. QI0442]